MSSNVHWLFFGFIKGEIFAMRKWYWGEVVFLPFGVKTEKYTIFEQFGRNGRFEIRRLILRS
jgi:hypothetical protein